MPVCLYMCVRVCMTYPVNCQFSVFSLTHKLSAPTPPPFHLSPSPSPPPLSLLPSPRTLCGRGFVLSDRVRPGEDWGPRCIRPRPSDWALPGCWAGQTGRCSSALEETFVCRLNARRRADIMATLRHTERESNQGPFLP